MMAPSYFDTLPAGWAFEYPTQAGPRLAVLAKETLRKGAENGFRSAIGQAPLLKLMAQPLAIYQGTRRLRYFEGEADWDSSDRILAVVCSAAYNRVWDNAANAFVRASPPTNCCFIAYLYDNESHDIRKDWQKRLNLPNIPDAKVCGYEWVPAVAGLPENADTRYSQKVYPR